MRLYNWIMTDPTTGTIRRFFALTKAGAKRNAKAYMRRHGWPEFRLRHVC